jgi:23S rRNA pseudouridine1911/1915/1917 synthase
MGRHYEAVVEGDLERAAGTFDFALVGDGTHRKRGVAGPGEVGKPAVTHWRVLERFRLATRVAVELETGRTHQIRIHFAAAGHPVVGEKVYRPRRLPAFPVAFPRLALHAAELAFEHPRDRRRIVVKAPLPADFRALLERLARARVRA